MKYFKVQELVSESTYKARGGRSTQLIDKRVITFIEGLREALGKPITINNWHVGGEYQWRGLRIPESPWYSTYSMHTHGKALDFDVKGMAAEEVRQWIIEHRELEWVRPVNFLEGGETVNWGHIDVRNGTDGNLWLWDKDTGCTTVYGRE